MLSAPFFSFVTKQTNLYYTMMEDFLQQYCKYLENALDSRVVVVLDGSGIVSNDESKTNQLNNNPPLQQLFQFHRTRIIIRVKFHFLC